MNALQKLIRAARSSVTDAVLLGGETTAKSAPIRLRSGDTIYYTATLGPRGGVSIKKHKVAGWILDHPAGFGEPSY